MTEFLFKSNFYIDRYSKPPTNVKAAGGLVSDTDSLSSAIVGYRGAGIYAYGNSTGGYFKDADNSG